MPEETTLKYRMSQVETRVEKLDDKVDSIMTNHLPHIQAEIASLNTSFVKALGDMEKQIITNTMKIGGVISVGMWVINFIANRFF